MKEKIINHKPNWFEKKRDSIRRRLKVYFLKTINRSCFEKLTPEQRQALIIFDKTINYPDSIPTQMPDGSKVFVEHKPKNLLIVADYANNRIKITNHVFQYIIDMNNRMAIHIDKSYRKHAEGIRCELETRYDSNVQNSLRNVIENINKY